MTKLRPMMLDEVSSLGYSRRPKRNRPCPSAEQTDELAHHGKVLAKLLRSSLGVRQSRLVADRLIDRFGSVGGVFKAPPTLLTTVNGLGQATARHISSVLETAQLLGQATLVVKQPVLGASSQLIDYCHVMMAYSPIEQFRVLFLDRKNRLIADEVQWTGTIDHTPVYPREVIKRALELSALALILVHNHPSGDPAPSSADVRMTKEIVDIAMALGIIVHDHIIIGLTGYASLRALKLMAGVTCASLLNSKPWHSGGAYSARPSSKRVLRN